MVLMFVRIKVNFYGVIRNIESLIGKQWNKMD